MKKLINGKLVDMTAEEIAQKEIDDAHNTAQTQAIEQKIQEQKNAKVSGNQKLLDLGLTQAEATALTGYTPPASEE